MRTIAATCSLLTMLCVFVGCNPQDPNRPTTYPTTITITMDGTPVEGATITLDSVDPDDDSSSYGQTDAKGVCELMTFDPGDGVIAGKYHVAVRKVEVITEPDPSEEDPNGTRVVERRRIVPEKYGKFGNGMEIDVTADGANEFSFDVAE